MTDRPTDRQTKSTDQQSDMKGHKEVTSYTSSNDPQKVRIKKSSDIIFLPQQVVEERTLCSLHFYVFSIQFVALRIFCKALCAN